MMEIINSVCEILATEFTESPIYISNSQEFKRPSFYVYLNQDDREPANKFLTHRNVTINIMYFAPMDDYNNPDIENGFLVLDTLAGLFMNSKLPVGDRYHTITKVTSGNYREEILYSLTIDYFTETPQNDETYDTMGTLNIDYK